MKSKPRIDFWLIGPVITLLIISLTTLYSLNIAFFKSQIISLFVGIVAYFFFSKINIEFFKLLKLPIYIISLVFLSIVLFIGIESRGAIRWIDILGIRLQFSEILKPFLSLAFAAFISEQRSPKIKSYILNILLLFPIVVLIFLQPDLGSALLYASVAIFSLIVFGFPILWFFALILPVIIASPILWLSLHEYQKQRIMAFTHSGHDPLGTSYNGIQSIIAVGSGSFWGKGISEGTQSVLRFLPERHTDFIFATIAEGLGFIGASIVIAALLLLSYRIYVIFRESDDLFVKTFISLSFGFLIIQGFVNIAMNIGLLPIVGITLPFVSFGGSSLLSNFIFLGLISAMSRDSKHKNVLEIK